MIKTELKVLIYGEIGSVNLFKKKNYFVMRVILKFK